ENDTVVQVAGELPDLRAEVVDFDPRDDIALLRVPGLREPPLRIASDAPAGRSVAILGYPEDGPFDAEPGRLGPTQTVRTENAYGNGPVARSVTSLRGLVRPGNSGGPLVDSSGHVLATVFAAITSGPQQGGFAIPDSLVRAQLAAAESATGRSA